MEVKGSRSCRLCPEGIVPSIHRFTHMQCVIIINFMNLAEIIRELAENPEMQLRKCWNFNNILWRQT
jgi:hypothetical protein